MQLEDYFEFETIESQQGPTERIRLKGHRINLEHVIAFFQEGFSPEGIAHEVFPTLTVTEVYTAVTYYLLNEEKIDRYMEQVDVRGEMQWEEYMKLPPPQTVQRIRKLKEELSKLPLEEQKRRLRQMSANRRSPVGPGVSESSTPTPLQGVP